MGDVACVRQGRPAKRRESDDPVTIDLRDGANARYSRVEHLAAGQSVGETMQGRLRRRAQPKPHGGLKENFGATKSASAGSRGEHQLARARIVK
jgi:hypothetical protein